MATALVALPLILANPSAAAAPDAPPANLEAEDLKAEQPAAEARECPCPLETQREGCEGEACGMSFLACRGSEAEAFGPAAHDHRTKGLSGLTHAPELLPPRPFV